MNAAAAAVRLGADATVIGAVGDDAAGRMIRAELGALGVHAELDVVPGAATGAFVLVDGEVRAQPGPPPRLPERIEADAVLVSGYLSGTLVDEALRRAAAEWVALAAAGLAELPPAPCVFANETEARALTGLPPEEAVRGLAEGRRLACVTRGAAGAVVVLDGRPAEARPPRVAQRETPGGGDALAGALLVALARGDDLERALEIAVAAGLDSLR